MRRRTGHAVSYSRIAALILRDARHEAIERLVRADGAVLEEGGRRTSAQLIPANSRLAAGASSHLHRMARQVRLVGSKVAIREAEHEPVAYRIDVLAGTRCGSLRDTNRIHRCGRKVATRSIGRGRNGYLREGGKRRSRPVDVKLEKI